VADTLILSADWVLPMDGEPRAGAQVVIEDGRIAAVGPADGGGERFPGCVILPGLVNAHSHVEYVGMSGFGDGLPFSEWLADHIRRRRALEPGDYLGQARAAALACLAGGVTTIADCCYEGTAATACAEAGLRAIVYLEAFSAQQPLRERLCARLDELAPGSELVRLGVSPHAPYTVSHDDYRLLVGLARARGLPVATHLLESEREREHLEAFRDVLGPDTVAIHAVQLTPDDVALLAELDVPVAHCPRSNALLGCGAAPLRALLDAGVRVGIGTDSPASALDLDLWSELRTAILIARARERRPDALTAAEALHLATLGGARALGLDGEVGSLTPGKAADLVVLDLAGSGFLPWHDPVSAAVYGGRPERVVLTMTAGEVRYRRDREDAGPAGLAEAMAARAKMLAP
jgi:cytosine/adenosine deaminase-related metal-dependent hydrolase